MLPHAARLPDKKPFTIGLEPLDPARWFAPDGKRVAELARKKSLIRQARDEIFMAEPGTQDAQRECYEAIASYLCRYDPDICQRADSLVTLDGNTVPYDDDAPLLSAAQLVQDDLCLMRRSANEWRLAAAALCFPSTWLLREKFGQPMSAIHAPVPDFAGTMAARVQRIFDSLQPGNPVCRMNWSIYEDADLRHAQAVSPPRQWRQRGVDPRHNAFLRIERQTLTKMPVSGDILFTIRIYADPLDAIRTMPDCAAALHKQLLAMSESQLTYKNLLQERDLLAEALAQIAKLTSEN